MKTDKILSYAKAIVSALVAGLIYFSTVLAPEASLSDITTVQWINFVISVLGSGVAVAAVPNKKIKPVEPPVPDVYEDGRVG